MFKPDLKADLTATGGIFTILICGFIWASSAYQSHTQLAKLNSQLLTAKHLVVDLHKENQQLQSSVLYLNQAYLDSQAEAKYYRKLSNLKEDLRQFTIEDQASALALGWTESNWDYKAKHNSSARGICGVMPLWDPYLAELKINPNSIEACIAIYNFYLDQTDSKTQAIKKYKGIESKHNLWIVKRTLEVRTYILHKLKED
jgi:hypothetical protein